MLYPKSLNIEKIMELKNLRIVHTVPVSDSQTGSWNGASRVIEPVFFKSKIKFEWYVQQTCSLIFKQLKDGELWNVFFQQDTNSARNTEHQWMFGTIFGDRKNNHLWPSHSSSLNLRNFC